MSIEAISSESVRAALRALRYSHSLAESPLLALALVTERLAAEGLADTRQARAWVLGQCIEGSVSTMLAGLRGDDAGSETRPSGDGELEALRRDLRSANDTRLDLALMHARYLAPSRRSVSSLGVALGLAERTVNYRVARGIDLLAGRLRDMETAAARRLASAGAARPRERIVIADEARPRPVVELMGELLAALRSRPRTAHVTLEQLAAVANYPAGEWVAYRLGRVAAWSVPRYRLDERFVQLSLLVDLGDESTSGRWQAKEQRFSDLREALDAVPEPAVVLLGPPGSGKSTLLRRLELDLAVAALTGESGNEGGPVTFLVSLNQYRAQAPGAALPEPRAWLAERWAQRYPKMPALDVLLAGGGVVLLLDGLNEMPHRDQADYRERVLAWKQFLHEHVAEVPGNRLVVACRSLDYSAPLSTPRLRVPQVRLEPLADEQVREFLARYSPANAEALWSDLAGTPLLEAVRWPFFLRMLVEQAAETGEVVGALSALFTGFVRRALVREVERDNPLFAPGELLDARDSQRLASGRAWRTTWELPERGLLFPALADLAHGMQESAAAEEMSQVRMGYPAAVGQIGEAHGADVIAAGCALGVLEEDRVADEVLFGHQLLQEYFAARRLARLPEPALAATPWRVADIRPGLREILDTLPPSETLPALPSTGWEETVILAAAMAEQPEPFLRDLMPHNLVVAGRAARLPAVQARLGVAFLDELRWALVGRSRDPAADLRARIDAGLALGWLGDPRFERRVGPYGEYLLPPMVTIPGGVYPIGEDEPLDWFGGISAAHCPRHEVELASFQIGRFPVTNAEYSCFMLAGGYDDERWWDTSAGRLWRRGIGTQAGCHREVRQWLMVYRSDPALLSLHRTSGGFDDEYWERWQRRLGMSDAELDSHLHAMFPEQIPTAPRYWSDARYNHPMQPVVAVSWYEARAYCAWLAAQTGDRFRLQTEVEWEAATRGQAGRDYAFGACFDPLAANTQLTRMRRPTPVGVFVEGDTPEGVSDLTGNVSELTASLYGVHDDVPDFGYPYDADDGRESAEATPDTLRVLRGSGFGAYHTTARSYFRDDIPADYRMAYCGFRLVVSSR